MNLINKKEKRKHRNYAETKTQVRPNENINKHFVALDLDKNITKIESLCVCVCVELKKTKIKMQFMSPVEKSQSTLYSVSTKSFSTTSDSNTGDDDETDELHSSPLHRPKCNGTAGVRTIDTNSDSCNGNQYGDSRDKRRFNGDCVDEDVKNGDNGNDHHDSDSDLSYNECDITLMDDDLCDAKNEAEMMFFQVVEMLRYEQEVCFCLIFFSFTLTVSFI